MSRWHAHSRVVVFHTLCIGQRDTILCLLIIYRLLRCTLIFSLPQDSSFTSLRHYSPLFPSAVAAAASRAPVRSIPTCYHHHIPNRSPGALSDPSHRSNSDRLAMCYATLFCCRLIYSSIVKNPASSLATAAEMYFHLPHSVLRGIRTVIRLVTWV